MLYEDYKKKIYRENSDLPEEQNSNFLIMDKLRIFLAVKKVIFINRNKDSYKEAYEIRTTKKESCDILINYFSNFPYSVLNFLIIVIEKRP